MRKNSVKNTRVNGEVQRVLAEIIRGGLKDPPDQSLDQCGRCGSGTGFKKL